MSREADSDETVLAGETATGATAVRGPWMVLALLGVLGLGLLAVAAAGASPWRDRLALSNGTVGAAFGQIATRFVDQPPGSAWRVPAAGAATRPRVPKGALSPSAGLAVTLRRVADASGVDPSQLHDAALDVQERTHLVDVAGVDADVRRWSEARLAARLLPVLSLGLAAVMFATLARPTGALGWSLLGFAVVLVVVGARWIGRLPGSKVGFMLESEREIDDRLQWFDQVAETLDTAQLYAAGGAGGSDALEAAAPVYVAHPVRRLLMDSQPASGSMDDPSQGLLTTLVRDLDRSTSPAGTQQLLASASEELRVLYQEDLERRVHLTRRGTLVVAFGCLGLVIVMLGAAFGL